MGHDKTNMGIKNNSSKISARGIAKGYILMDVKWSFGDLGTPE